MKWKEVGILYGRKGEGNNLALENIYVELIFSRGFALF